MNDNKHSCMDDFDPDSLLIEEAVARIFGLVTAIDGEELLPITAALGRVTADTVTAGINVPSHTCSAMDGYAIRYSDLSGQQTRFTLVGKSLAGHPYKGELKPSECVRITTGAVLPIGADTVVMQEHAVLENQQVHFSQAIKAGQFARAPGTDTKIGDTLLPSGKRLSPADIALLASQGITTVKVRPTLRVAIISTGDELLAPGKPLQTGKIYDSNRAFLAATLQQLHIDCIDIGIAEDSPQAIEDAFNAAAEQADVIVSSGGVSVGEADYVRLLLDAHGKLNFWKIAMKPGRPLTVAQYKDKPFFGLPGNPVSVAVTFTQLVRPALEKMSGTVPVKPHTTVARTLSKLRKQAGRLEFQRGILRQSSDGEWQVETTGLQDSHVLSSLSKANCYIVLPLESDGADIGDQVKVELIDC